MQSFAHSGYKRLRNPGHLEAKYALSEVRKRLGERVDSGVTQQLSTRPADVRLAEAAFAQQLRPEVGLLMFEPFNVGRHGVAHAEVSKKVMPRCIDHN